MNFEDCNLFLSDVFKHRWTTRSFDYTHTFRPNYGIMLLTKGKIDFKSNDGELCANEGNIIFLPKKSFYEAVFRIEFGAVENYLINFETDKVLLKGEKPMLVSESASPDEVTMFEKIVEGGYSSDGSAFKRKGMLYLLMDSIFNDNAEEESESDKVLNKAKRMLQSNQNYSMGEIARECCVSESGLRKIFKKKIGISPVQYKIDEKITRAKYLLESTDKSLEEISEVLNFFDTAHFCRIFQKYTGMSPGRYSKNKKL